MTPKIDGRSRFRHVQHAAWRRVGEDSSVILDLETSVYFTLNETGTAIWELLGEGRSPDEIQDGICERFQADSTAVRKDVHALIKSLLAENLLSAL